MLYKGLHDDIDPDYPIVVGEWDVKYLYNETKNTCILNYKIVNETKIKQLIIPYMTIIKAYRIR